MTHEFTTNKILYVQLYGPFMDIICLRQIAHGGQTPCEVYPSKYNSSYIKVWLLLFFSASLRLSGSQLRPGSSRIFPKCLDERERRDRYLFQIEYE